LSEEIPSTSENPPRRRGGFDWSALAVGVIAGSAALTVYLRDGAHRFHEILFNDLSLFGGVMPRILAGCLLGALLANLLPRERVSQLIGTDSGLPGLLIAAVLGALLPGGPFTVYPVASALLVIGADFGATVTFVTSWTLIGYARAVVWELPLVGGEFTLFRIVICIPLVVVAGITARVVLRLMAGRTMR
jgi:uncharacterized membrane protein YraQ (UPF0718 family)